MTVVGGRMLFAAPVLTASHVGVLNLLLVLLAAGGAGATGGLVHGFLGERLLSLPRLGPYVWGVACVSAYMGALAVVAPWAFGESLISDRLDLALFVGGTVLFGLLMGFGYVNAERGYSFYNPEDTNWRFVAAVSVIGAVLALATKVAGWW
jgi:hypothetical protein